MHLDLQNKISSIREQDGWLLRYQNENENEVFVNEPFDMFGCTQFYPAERVCTHVSFGSNKQLVWFTLWMNWSEECFCTNGIRVIKEMKYELPDVPVISIALRLRALMMVTVRRPAVGK